MLLYHETKRKNLPSIMKNGLCGNGIGIVYLSPVPNAGWGEVCLKVETGKARLTAFTDCEEWEVLCWGKIPPKSIQVA